MNTLRCMCMCQSNQNRWDTLNNTRHAAHGLTSFAIMFGRQGREPVDDQIGLPTDDKPVYQTLQDLSNANSYHI